MEGFSHEQHSRDVDWEALCSATSAIDMRVDDFSCGSGRMSVIYEHF